jgi:hypothetical protein
MKMKEIASTQLRPRNPHAYPSPVGRGNDLRGRSGRGGIQLNGELGPNKSKQNQAKSLDLLGFIRPNWGFSMGYGESK